MGRFARRAWSDLGQDPAALELVEVSGRPVPLPSSLPVGELAYDAVAVASLALALAGPARGPERVRLDPDRVATAFTSERHFRLDGQPADPWAPLSGFWRTGDGWVRTHANYPHHERRLRALLGLAADAERVVVERAIGRWDPAGLEEAAAEVGALAVAVRSPEEWWADPQAGRDEAPWITLRRTDEAPATSWRAAEAAPRRPLAGLRVLDLTRVIAGPVAGRTLAVAGADVLRVDPPHLPEPAWQHLDTGHHKRSTLLDLRGADRAVFEDLARAADVLLVGYAPAVLEHSGLDADSVAERFPGLVTGYVRAWSADGPWADRRGFDSLVQAATGIAVREGVDGRPGVLPAQALDHATGYLLAAAVATLVARREVEGGAWSAAMSLQRAAELLLAGGDGAAGAHDAGAELEPQVVELAGEAGVLTTAAPALYLGGVAGAYDRPARPWGRDAPRWSTGAP